MTRYKKHITAINLTLILAGNLILFTIAAFLDLFERFHNWSRVYESYNIDEITIILASAALGVTVFALHKCREVIKETEKRSLADAALKSSETEYQAMFNNSRDAIFFCTREGQFEQVNSAMLDLLDYTKEEMLGHKLLTIYQGKEDIINFQQEIEKSGSVKNYEMKLQRRDGKSLCCLLSATLWQDSHGNIRGYQGIIRDVTEQRKLENQVLQAKEDWEEAFNTINDGITIHDMNFNIIKANKAAEELLGLSAEKILGQKCHESYHGTPCAPKGCPSCQSLQTGIPSITEVFEPHLDKYVEIKALPQFDKNRQLTGLVHIVRDIDDRKKAEKEQQTLQAQLYHAQKMEAIGTMASGVAHDLNNILTTILGYSELIFMDKETDESTKDYIGTIHDAGQKAADLTRQLLSFSRKQVMEVKLTNLNTIVENMGKMLGRLIGDDVVMELSISESTGNIMADVGQLEQILMNLVINARAAMPEGGRLTIATGGVYLDEQYAQNHSTVTPGPHAILTVTDTGAGMSPDVQERIFEPFFTTKEVGKGTGLGLSTAYGIVKQHNGHIYVYSEPGQGTTFKIFFPVAGGRIEQKAVEKTRKLERGQETILIVDDDSSVRRLLFHTLEPLGYKLLQAASGEEALEISRHSTEKIDLLLSDMIMPGINGKGLIGAIKEERPGIKTVLMSGYTNEAILSQDNPDSEFFFINKPLLPIALANRLRDILDMP